MCTSLVKLPHIRTKIRVTRAMHYNKVDASTLLEAMKAEQKAEFPMGAPRMVRLGVQDFIWEGNMLRSSWLKSSHFGGLK